MFYAIYMATRPRGFALVLVPVFHKTLGLMLYLLRKADSVSSYYITHVMKMIVKIIMSPFNVFTATPCIGTLYQSIRNPLYTMPNSPVQ